MGKIKPLGEWLEVDQSMLLLDNHRRLSSVLLQNLLFLTSHSWTTSMIWRTAWLINTATAALATHFHFASMPVELSVSRHINQSNPCRWFLLLPTLTIATHFHFASMPVECSVLRQNTRSKPCRFQVFLLPTETSYWSFLLRSSRWDLHSEA